MSAFNNPYASQTVDMQPIGTLTVKNSTTHTSDDMKLAPNTVLGKSYPSTYAAVVGTITTLGEGKKITISLYVNDVLKSSKIYSATGYTEDAAMANVTADDDVHFVLSTDDTVDTVTKMVKVMFIAGAVPASEVLS